MTSLVNRVNCDTSRLGLSSSEIREGLMGKLTGRKIRAELIKCGRSNAWLAGQLGISRQAVGKIISGETARTHHMHDIAIHLSVDVNYLLDDTIDIEAGDLYKLGESGGSEKPSALSCFDELIEKPSDNGLTEIVSQKSAVAFPEWACGDANPDNVVFCTILGDSMSPLLPDGSRLLANKDDTKIADGKLYALDVMGMLQVRRVYRMPGGFTLKAYNDQYDDMQITGDAIDQFSIIGRVIWCSFSLG